MSGLPGDGFGRFGHGTEARYSGGCRCDDCKCANTQYVRDRAERRWDATLVHGTTLAYNTYKCRCPECKAAQSQYKRELRAEGRRVYLETMQRLAAKNGGPS